MRRRILVAVGVLVLILLAGAAAAYYVTQHRFGGDVVGSSSGFVSTQTAPPPKRRGAIEWQMFGAQPQHLHTIPAGVRPPFRLDWTANGSSLIEFPPAVGFHKLFYATLAGKLKAAATSTGRKKWGLPVGRCEAAGPAVSAYKGGTVYETFLNRVGGPCIANTSSGLVIAVDAASPKSAGSAISARPRRRRRSSGHASSSERPKARSTRFAPTTARRSGTTASARL